MNYKKIEKLAKECQEKKEWIDNLESFASKVSKIDPKWDSIVNREVRKLRTRMYRLEAKIEWELNF